MPDLDPGPDNDVPAALTRLAASLPALDPAATTPVVLALWEGTGLAHACGAIAAAADETQDRWSRRSRNAEAVEHLLARHLTHTTAAAGQNLRLDILPAPAARPGPGDADAAVTAVLAFAGTAGPAAQAAAAAATVWDDRRSLSAWITLTTELAACWRGERPFYRLRPDTPAPPWWAATPPGPAPP
ncbi:hypothetical protein [Amycolatopsis sp. PS_44_ISF1]|uniref:hypothetical protein n=1 Tax=Amycolatopsis sp. PS_44_ISF1 TaxID=2974917 RepID=UPI0028DD7785|nr:hypothetical protein [Amycolatopsis sp. PS_44_ISF1]MDT8913726.1 hypothetical protein [Amycolatopsis sp. PS_44_ISF1]MDT8916213.1 hypothetical protein [Amycolatopsis sp. PS_44_ISF1]